MMLSPLRRDDRVSLLAPSSPFDAEKFHRSLDMLIARGIIPAPGKNIFHTRSYLAGAEAERAQDLIDAITEPSTAAVMCIRGGYGSGRLLPWLPFHALRRAPKIFIGYSDITFLHVAFRSQMGWVTFHGPNLMDLAEHTERIDDFMAALRGQTEFAWELHETSILKHGVASGEVFGGNLACLTHLLGTPYFPNPQGALLMVEDRGEALYRLDRLFTQLGQAGVLSRLGGLILGNFEGCGETNAIHDMVLETLKPFNFPVIGNMPFGHGCKNEVIPLGAPFYLNTYEGIFKALQHPFIR